MSFSALNYDPCAYEKNVKQSIGTGEYVLSVPKNNCKNNCFYPSPYIRLDKTRSSSCKNKLLVDIDSELIGLNTIASKCHKPIDYECNEEHLDDCSNNFLSPEDTKLSNPPCTLRGTGWNRWEWLCENPQDKSMINFQTNINDRIVAKDNHRPLVPLPLSQEIALPDNKCDDIDSEILDDYSMIGKYENDIPFVHWRCCGEIAKY